MTRLAPALFFLTLAAGARAQDAGEIERCHAMASTAAIVDCLGKVGTEADRHLNVAYQAALKALSPRGTTAMRESERAWLEYRNKRCAAIASGDGTVTQVIAADCMVQMTRARAEELDADARGAGR